MTSARRTDSHVGRRVRQDRARRTREQILDAALDAFAREGYDGVSLNSLIRESGLTKGAFYFHFASKDELALAAFRHGQEKVVGLISAEAARHGDALEQLSASFRARTRLYREMPSLRGVLRLGVALGAKAGPDSEYARFQELTIEFLSGIVARGQAEGSVRPDLDPRATGELIFAMMVGTDQVSRILAGRADIDRRTEHLLDVLVNGLRTSSGRGAPGATHGGDDDRRN